MTESDGPMPAASESYPYRDWPAIAKTAPQKSTDEQKAAEQSGSSGNKAEPSLLEKAGRALEAITGGSPTPKEGASQEGASQMKSSPSLSRQGKAKANASIFVPRAARIGFAVVRP